jgi:hypothetical protein
MLLTPVLFALTLLGPQAAPSDPRLATEAARANERELARLQQPGEVLFHDEFESTDSFAGYFEIRGREDGRVSIDETPGVAHAGRGALRCISRAAEGRSSGAGASGWLGAVGRERVHLRYYVKFAADYDQGNLNHTGGGLSGVAGTDKWAGMGGAGLRPKGDDNFSTRFEAWRDGGRLTPPGYLYCYTYWMEMKIDKDGHYWGNMLAPLEQERAVPERGKWYCHELMVKTNEPGSANGELAAWIDGKLYLHYTGIRWRSDAKVLLKRFSLDVYVHAAAKENVVWYDDVVLSTGYVGPAK